MLNSSPETITKLARVFLEPSNSTHRQYEALRAYFVEGVSSKEAAKRFGYTEGSFRVLVHQFRQNPHRQFFLPPLKGPHKAPKKDKVVLRRLVWILITACKHIFFWKTLLTSRG